jgi:hypothetical protein
MLGSLLAENREAVLASESSFEDTIELAVEVTSRAAEVAHAHCTDLHPIKMK